MASVKCLLRAVTPWFSTILYNGGLIINRQYSWAFNYYAKVIADIPYKHLMCFVVVVRDRNRGLHNITYEPSGHGCQESCLELV